MAIKYHSISKPAKPCYTLLKSNATACFLSSLLTFLASFTFFYFDYKNKLAFEQNEHHELLAKVIQAHHERNLLECPDVNWRNMAIKAQCYCTDEKGLDLTKSSPGKNTSRTFPPGPNQLVASDFTKMPNVVVRWAANTTEASNRSPQITGRRVLINYASGCCFYAQQLNCDTGLNVGGFDVCLSFSEWSIDADFRSRNSRIFDNPFFVHRYWIWKPYIIWSTLLAMRDDDVMFYADSGSHFLENLEEGPIRLMAERGLDIALFTYEAPERRYTKSDVFFLMDCLDEAACYNSTHLTASFMLFRKTIRSLQFVSQWLTYAQDYRILGGELTEMVKPMDREFRQHRNDQSVLSLLAKKWKIEFWPDPSQWGEASEFGRSLRAQPQFNRLLNRNFINHTREKY